MKPLFILITVFVFSLLIIKVVDHTSDYQFSGCLAMTFMLLFTGIGHFKFPKGMVMMMPDFMPVKTALVYFTGIFEFAAAICLQVLAFRTVTSWLLILFFVLILPANIYSAIKHVDYEKGNNEGKGIGYLWFRIPLQLFFIGWIYYFGIYLNSFSST